MDREAWRASVHGVTKSRIWFFGSATEPNCTWRPADEAEVIQRPGN